MGTQDDESGAGTGWTRRGFVSVGAASLAASAFGCGDDDGGATGGPGTTSAGGTGDGGTDGDAGPGEGADDDGADGSTGGTGVEPFGWDPIPDLALMVGVPVQFDLAAFVNGAGAPLSISLDGALPAGLLLEGTAIVGTPEVQTPGADLTATVDVDGMVAISEPFAIRVDPASALVQFEFERATPEQLAVHLPLLAPLPEGTMATVRYREAGDDTWRSGHPLVRINPDWVTTGAPTPPVDAFAGTVFDLTPGASYELEITIEGPGIDTEVLSVATATRPLPLAAGAATMNASPQDDLQAQLDAMGPGDVLELADGIYDVSDLSIAVQGSADQPIVVRGQSRDGVVLRASGRVLHLLETSHLVVENMTLEGPGVDSGTDASSQGIGFWNGFVQEHVTLRALTITGVDQGVIAPGTVLSVLIYECILSGNNEWTADFIETNLTWNDDGIRIPGEGNCAFNNTLHAFGDTCAVTDGVASAAIYFYRNRITMTGDDACEGDYSTRNFAFYDNHVSNCATALSLDPVWGGPLYFFRNIIVNTTRGPFKFNNTNSGFLVYNNTLVRTNGLTDWGWVQFNNGELRGYAYRNNLLVFAGGTGNLLALESGGNDPLDFSHNAWSPQGSVWWSSSGGSFGSVDDARSSLPPTTPLFGAETQRHAGDVIVDSAPFVDPIPLGADHLAEVTALYVPTLAEGSPAQGAGVEIANITDGFSGRGPDIGAVIGGRPLPTWGAS